MGAIIDIWFIIIGLMLIGGIVRAILNLGAPFGCFGMLITFWIALVATPALL